MKTLDGTEILICADRKHWQTWLSANHAQARGVWLLIAKKGSDKPAIAIGDALDVALCYGWIDSQRKGYDADYYLQRYSARTAKSPWSKLNVERVEALIAVRGMRAAGLAEVAAAKADGRWAVAYASQRSAEIPGDVAAALKENKRARAAYTKLAKSAQYAIFLPVLKATTPALRALRLERVIAKLAKSES
jgi:uncharacterized protein YdeI (YjbR/CyaY-like superfamily)